MQGILQNEYQGKSHSSNQQPPQMYTSHATEMPTPKSNQYQQLRFNEFQHLQYALDPSHNLPQTYITQTTQSQPPRSTQYQQPANFDQAVATKHQQPYYHPHSTTAITSATTPIRTQPRKEQAFIIGDSMVKDLEGHKMSRRKNVTVHSTSGADSAAFKHYIKPVIAKRPKEIVIHCGTNDMENPNIDTITNIKDIIEEIARNAPETIIAISSIISRYDKPHLNGKIKELNKEIRQLCINLGAAFINNDNIGSQNLNGSRLHLNKSGNIAFARNMISFLQSN